MDNADSLVSPPNGHTLPDPARGVPAPYGLFGIADITAAHRAACERLAVLSQAEAPERAIQSRLAQTLAAGRSVLEHLYASASLNIARVRKLAARSIMRQRKLLRERAAHSLQSRFEELDRRLQTTARSAVEQLQSESLELALALAREIVMSEVRQNPQSLLARIERVLVSVAHTHIQAFRLRPDEANEVCHAIKQRYPSAALIADASLRHGTATVETSQGLIGIDHELHLERLEQRLRRKFAEDRSSHRKDV